MKAIIIGGGASGFFAALSIAEHDPNIQVVVLEKTSKVLSKVKVSGGGRCNVTHHCLDDVAMADHYPRGRKELLHLFKKFSVKDTLEWFEKNHVQLKTEEDNRVFPSSDDSQTIIDCFLRKSKSLGIQVLTKKEVLEVQPRSGGIGFELKCSDGSSYSCDRLLVCTGGYPKLAGFEWLKRLGHRIIEPVPSLFTFNLKDKSITSLMGISEKRVRIKILNTKITTEGILLITHWGFSAYAVLRASAWGARVLNEMAYQFKIQISWLPDHTEESLMGEIKACQLALAKRQVANRNPFGLTARLWEFFLERAGIPPERIWAELNKKEMNKMIQSLLFDTYQINGKTTFKEEFVTAGGIDLKEIDLETMQSKICKGLYFAGEVLDMDGLTGGFNFQAAWTTGYLAGKNIGKEIIRN